MNNSANQKIQKKILDIEIYQFSQTIIKKTIEMQEYLKQRKMFYVFLSKYIFFFQIWQKARLTKANAQGIYIIKFSKFKEKNVLNKVIKDDNSMCYLKLEK